PRSSSTDSGISSPPTGPRRSSWRGSRPRCSTRRATCCARRCTRRASRRASHLDEWTPHILGNLRRQIAVTGGDGLRELEAELAGYAVELGVADPRPHEGPRAIAMPMRLRTDDGELAFMTMVATFGTALDITLTELALETFLPADAATAAALQRRFG